jgi:acetyl esterase
MPTPNNQMQMILDAHAEMGPLPIENLDPVRARQIPLPDRAAVAVYGQHFIKKALAPMPLPVGRVEHRALGADVLLRIYTPKGDMPKGGWPSVVYFHGGGFVIATLDTYDASCRALCDGAHAKIISVHYRQAPENPWPAAVEDAFNAYQWVQENTRQLNLNPNQIAIAGESAGGNLATVVCLIARTQKAPMPVHQLLVYPVTDMANGVNSASARENANAKPLNRAMLNWFYGHYLQGEDAHHPSASPLLATSHQGLPAATVILAEIDPLRSDGEAYAKKLKEAGVPVNLKVFDGVTHEFFGLVGLVDEAAAAMKMACDDLKDAFEARLAPRKIA